MLRLERLSRSKGGLSAEVAAEHPPEGARRVPARRLDLDDVSTPVGEDPTRPGARDPHAELDNAYAGERTFRHGLRRLGFGHAT